MKNAIVTVQPGNMGPEKTFRIIDGNREIDPEYCRRNIKPNIDWISEYSSALELIEKADGTGQRWYDVLDGQHRIWTVANMLDHPVKFAARVRTPAELPADLSALLVDLHKSKRWGLKDSLYCTRSKSPWDLMAQKLGFNAMHTTSGKSDVFVWGAVIRARILADYIARRGAVIRAQDSQQLLLKMWLDYPDERISMTFSGLRWWAGCAEAARLMGARGMYAYSTLAIALAIYAANPIELLESVPGRFSNNPAGVCSISSRATLIERAAAILAACNYRMQRRLITLCGSTGREDGGMR